MYLFLIQYDRDAGRLVAMTRFDSAMADQAVRARLQLELALAESKTDHEVVLLEAASDEDLLLTHRRYFAGLTELASASDLTDQA
jgi:hypothetical protein